MSFEVGDIVKLKAGGPDMAINIFSQYNGGYKCQWFAGKKLEEGYFPADSLELVEKDN